MSEAGLRPKVGVGVVVMRDGHVLVGKRKGSHGAGTWSLPGGNLEFGESFEQCAARELREETGLRITNVHFVWACNSVFDASTHYVTIFMRGSLDGGHRHSAGTSAQGASAMGNTAPAKHSYPEPTVIPAREKHTATVIMMHGLGDTAAGWAPVGKQLSAQMPHVKSITVNMGMAMPGWFDIYDLGSSSLDRKEDTGGIRDAAKFLDGLIRKENDAGTPSERIVVAGFSQGGAVAVHALRDARKYAGVIGLSTWAPLHRDGNILSNECKGTPVFLAHGTQDNVVRTQFGEMTQKLLAEKGAQVTWKTYPMPHSACDEELADMAQFLMRVLPKQ